MVGEGSFGAVFKARDKESGDTVAIKQILQDKRYMDRELLIAKMLHHPNCIELKDHFQTGKRHLTYNNHVMDYLPSDFFKLQETCR